MSRHCHRVCVPLPQHSERVSFGSTPVDNNQQKDTQKNLLVALAIVYSTSLECTDKPVTRNNVCPAALADVAGSSPNLA